MKNLSIRKAMLTFVMASYTFVVGFNDNTERHEYYAKSDISLKKEYDTNSQTLKIIPEFEKMELIYEGVKKSYVSYNGKNGYVDNDFIEKIDGDYVEVDISEQKIIYNKNGDIILESDVVTGTKGKNDTPVGYYSVYSNERNRYLEGTGYRSYVRLWLPFNGGVGLHDASWRKEFGSDIYEKNGSHGCVNLPDEAADVLIREAHNGLKVLVHK